MKVYAMFKEWSNEGTYEDAENDFEFYGVCDTLDKAIQELKKHIPKNNQEEKIYELEWESDIGKPISYMNHDRVYFVASVRRGDGYDYTTYNEDFYIVEEELI